jgi:signal transduction histidine kinase
MATSARRRFFWAAHPLQAVVESGALGVLLLWGLASLAGRIHPAALSNGHLALCGVCGMWVVLRARLPRRAWYGQLAQDLAAALGLSILMAVGLRLLAQATGWDAVWQASTIGVPLAVLLLAAIGPGYLVARGGVRVVLWWDRLRRRRMLWSLTHAHLVLVLIVVLLVSTILVAAALWNGAFRSEGAPVGLVPALVARLLHTIFPAAGILAGVSGAILLAVLPPSALFSYLVARRTTRRLEDLAAATSALRQGQYAARVTVRGEDEVAQLQADFNAMAEDLSRTLQALAVERDSVRQLLASRRELVASVSHELRTPVATMRAQIESTLAHWDDAPPPSLRRDLEVMEGEVLRLQRLIDDLFALSQAEIGALDMSCAAVDVAAVAGRMVDAVAPLAWQSGRVDVVADLPPNLPPAWADEARLEQVLSNLLRNAVRHTPPGGIVALVAAAEPDAVRIEVRDTGEGIAPHDLARIWERFYRGANVRTRDGRGAGLGLALVKEFVEAMEGTVAVESAVGEGSCFTVRLPRQATRR